MYYKQMILNRPFSIEQVKSVMGSYELGTRQLSLSYTRFKALAKFAQIDLQAFERELKGLQGDYSIGSETGIKRQLLTDEEIVSWYNQLKSPLSKWCFGALATWGLRPHELWLIDLDTLSKANSGLITVLPEQNGIVGKGKHPRSRSILPCRPNWFYDWELWNYQLPQSKGVTARDLGHVIGAQFKRNKTPFLPYDLRHAWAVRALHSGLPTSQAARAMGHRLTVHERIYLYWIDEQ
ncbi:hypothetical protein VZG28_06410 [Synechococcus elongatus IITB4]|uniref:hypothetical protein n=1 Tax=Synechococcus elongatus TaxID=32046 RepID=UPI0030D033FA